MSNIDYKTKYKEMKAKMLESVDVSYRLGYEQGFKEATQESQMAQMQQQQQEAAAMQQAAMGGQQDPNAMGGDQGGMPPEMGGQQMPPEAGGQMAPEDMGQEGEPEQGGGELDQYLAELENMVSKGEKPSVIDLRNKVTEIATLRKSQKEKMKSNRQQVVSAQKSIVDNLIKKWGSKTEETSEDIEKLIREKGIEI
jgi:hypothetical protein